jgi:putative dehydrogenase
MSDRVGVIGVGNMGAAMAARLLERGFQVVVRDIRHEAEAPLLAAGAECASSPREIARACNAIVIVVVNAGQVDDVLSGEDGLLPALRSDRLVVIHSTIAPGDATRLAQAIQARGALALDAPISGGPARARAGQLSIMAAGSAAALDRAQPLFAAFAARVFEVGAEPGLGATMKLVNNLLAGAYLAVGAEAFAIGRAAGLDARTMAEVFATSSGQSWILTDRLARVLADDAQPRAQMHILAKDLRLAEDLARSLGKPTTLGAATSALFTAAMASGLRDADDSALISWAAR